MPYLRGWFLLKHHPIDTMSCLPGWFLLQTPPNPHYVLLARLVPYQTSSKLLSVLLSSQAPTQTRPKPQYAWCFRKSPTPTRPRPPSASPARQASAAGPPRWSCATPSRITHIHTSSNAFYFRKGPSSFGALTEASALHFVKHRAQKEAICWDRKFISVAFYNDYFENKVASVKIIAHIYLSVGVVLIFERT